MLRFSGEKVLKKDGVFHINAINHITIKLEDIEVSSDPFAERHHDFAGKVHLA